MARKEAIRNQREDWGMNTPNFFDHHSVICGICLVFFPRTTLLIGSFASGGLLWWLGWLFTPYFLIAIMSIPFWDSNPALCVFAWILAFVGTATEYDHEGEYV